MKNSKLCPCHSTILYVECCKPFHQGDAFPPTALQLMRSRYSAYSLRMVDYLVETTHPSKRKPSYRKQLSATVHGLEWIGLDILKSSLGGVNDSTGKVKFSATYIEKESEYTMTEHSRFRKKNGVWYYYDGKG